MLRGACEWLFHNLTRLFAALTFLLLLGIIISLFIGAWPTLKTLGLSFLTRSEWNPPMDNYGALIAIYGTLVTSLIALVIALTLSASA